MAWYAVYEEADGKLLSITTLLPEVESPLAFKELGEEKPDWTVEEWDPVKFQMAPKPPREPEKDKVDDLLAAVPALAKLNPVETAQLKEEVGKLLGDDRYYTEAEAVAAKVEE